MRFDEGTWEEAGTLDASLRKMGVTIPPMDILIASVCLDKGDHPPFTFNQPFQVIPELKCLTHDDLQSRRWLRRMVLSTSKRPGTYRYDDRMPIIHIKMYTGYAVMCGKDELFTSIFFLSKTRF